MFMSTFCKGTEGGKMFVKIVFIILKEKKSASVFLELVSGLKREEH